MARLLDSKMKIQGEVSYKCENVATLDPISFETPEAYISLPKWNTKRMGSISFDFRTTEPNGLILFTHGKPQERKDAARSQKNTKVSSEPLKSSLDFDSGVRTVWTGAVLSFIPTYLYVALFVPEKRTLISVCVSRSGGFLCRRAPGWQPVPAAGYGLRDHQGEGHPDKSE